MFCSECGKQVADNAKFCGECGAVQADTGKTPKVKVEQVVSPTTVTSSAAPSSGIGKIASYVVGAIMLVGLGYFTVSHFSSDATSIKVLTDDEVASIPFSDGTDEAGNPNEGAKDFADKWKNKVISLKAGGIKASENYVQCSPALEGITPNTIVTGVLVDRWIGGSGGNPIELKDCSIAKTESASATSTIVDNTPQQTAEAEEKAKLAAEAESMRAASVEREKVRENECVTVYCSTVDLNTGAISPYSVLSVSWCPNDNTAKITTGTKQVIVGQGSDSGISEERQVQSNELIGDGIYISQSKVSFDTHKTNEHWVLDRSDGILKAVDLNNQSWLLEKYRCVKDNPAM